VAVGNKTLGHRLEDGKLKGKAGVTDLTNTGMDMEYVIEKGSVMVLTEGFHVVKIDTGLQKLIVAIANCLEVLGQGHVKVSKVVAEENVTLLVRLDVPYLDGLEKPINI